MKIAVVGGGFAGLALCLHLLEQGCQVTLFEKKEIGAGSSGLASGLLHPYVGEDAKRSYKATEGLESAKQLLLLAQEYSKDPVADYRGIVRKAQEKDQIERLRAHVVDFGDVEEISPGEFWIRSGITVHSLAYLRGLYEACRAKGLRTLFQEIGDLAELSSYEQSILAVGASVHSFPLGSLAKRLRRVKGQVLTCRWPFPDLACPLMEKGHIVPLSKGVVSVGSTYERGEVAEGPCLEAALEQLTPRMKTLVPDWSEISVLGCRAGWRVSHTGHYFPVLEQIQQGIWVMTGLGSRGLLYHAYGAKLLVDQVLVFK